MKAGVVGGGLSVTFPGASGFRSGRAELDAPAGSVFAASYILGEYGLEDVLEQVLDNVGFGPQGDFGYLDLMATCPL